MKRNPEYFFCEIGDISVDKIRSDKNLESEKNPSIFVSPMD